MVAAYFDFLAEVVLYSAGIGLNTLERSGAISLMCCIFLSACVFFFGNSQFYLGAGNYLIGFNCFDLFVAEAVGVQGQNVLDFLLVPVGGEGEVFTCGEGYGLAGLVNVAFTV